MGGPRPGRGLTPNSALPALAHDQSLTPLIAYPDAPTRCFDTLNTFTPFRRFISETIAGNIAGAPAPRLAKADRTGILPLDLIKQHHKAIKLALYGKPVFQSNCTGVIVALRGRDHACRLPAPSSRPCGETLSRHQNHAR